MGSRLAGRRVLVLGGWGLVGAAVCRELTREAPERLLVHSLHEAEAREAVGDLARLFPAQAARLLPVWGDVLLSLDLQGLTREELLKDEASRGRLLDEIYGDLTPGTLSRSALFRLIDAHRPHVIVDCVNLATGLAYQDVDRGVRRIRRLLRTPHAAARLAEAVEEQLGMLQMPRLIRHVQVLFEAMRRSGTELYLKIGTTGTGGMGLNVPYTHSEERPSRQLLSKSGLAGAHTMLLFLMNRTPGGPIVKEIKPAAAVAWKRIGKGPVLRGGRPIPLYDCPPEEALSPAEAVRSRQGPWRPLAEGAVLEAAFVDTGENGVFSLEEFETVTALGQMEYVTPEEIARHVLAEVGGAGTGRDVVAALSGAVLGPSYRAGALRRQALDELEALDSSQDPSVAFEMLGPPRLSKLLYEAHLLHGVCEPIVSLPGRDPGAVSRALAERIGGDARLRARVLSIGLAILLPDGRLLRGPVLSTPPAPEEDDPSPTAEDLERWARAGWVDLRPASVALWQERISTIASRHSAAPIDAGSSAYQEVDPAEGPRAYSPGKLAAWIFANEEGGVRYL